MVSPVAAITPALTSAIESALGEEFAGSDPVLRPSQYADVQVNAALALAKRAKRAPGTSPPRSSRPST